MLAFPEKTKQNKHKQKWSQDGSAWDLKMIMKHSFLRDVHLSWIYYKCSLEEAALGAATEDELQSPHVSDGSQ